MGARGAGFRHTNGFGGLRWRWLGLGVGLLLLGALPPAAQAALSSAPDNDWVTNGPVYAMARSGNTIYLGGSFSQVGPRTGPAVSFTGGSSTADSGFPQVSGGQGLVRTAISDGAGGWYIGGNFTHVGGVARAGLAHVEAGGVVDPTFAPSLEVAHGWSVEALALSGSTLYVGGSFPSISGTARDGLAALNTTDGSLQGFNPGPTTGVASVESLTLSGGTLYVGGHFTEMGGQTRDSLAAFTTSTGTLTSWAPEATGVNSQVKGLAVSGSTVYLAGSFDHVGSQARSAFAAVDTTGALTSWNPEASGCGASAGLAVAATGAVVYVGGCFSHIGGQTRNGVAALDPSTATATSWNPGAAPGTGATTSAIAVSGSTIYVTGGFTEIGGQARNGVAALDATTAEATSWNPSLNVNATNPLEGATEASAVAASGSQVLVGGSFSSAGGLARKDLAAIDASTGEATAWNPGVVPVFKLVNQPIRAISIAGGVVYVGGSFSSAGGQTRANLAALDPTTGNATSWNPGASSPSSENSVVAALLATPQAVYVGGSFTTLGGASRSNLGAVNTSGGAATNWNPQIVVPKADTEHGVAAVGSLALSGTSLYLGGWLTELGGQSRTGAGALNIETGEATAWDPVLSGLFPGEAVTAKILAVSGSATYIATNSGLMAVDATSGAALPWHPVISAGQTAAIQTAAIANGAVYLGGVALDAGSGLPLAWNPQLSGFLFGSPTFASAVMASGNHVYLAGAFRTTDLAAASGFAAFTITGPINTEPPTITGTGAEGQALTEHHGSWTGTPTSYAYQWLRCLHNPPFQLGCTLIAGATGQSYTPTPTDTGATIEVQETATNAEGPSDPVGSAATVAVFGPPANTAPPIVTGTPSVGQTMSCSTGTWTGSPTGYQYAWLRDFAPIPGATAASYTITGSDAGHDLTCEVTATNAAGSRQALADAGTIPASEGGGGSGGGGSSGGGSGPGGSSGGGSTSTGAGGRPSSGGTTSPASPSPSAVTAALAAVLSAKGALPTISTMLKAGGYSLSFNAPGAGVLKVQWTTRAHGGHQAKPVVIASGSQTFGAAGRGTVKLRLTTTGRELLKKNQALRVTDQATFTPSSGAAQTKQTTLRIRSGKKTGHR